MTADEIEAFNHGILTSSRSWNSDISVPVANSSGTNGAQLDGDFIFAPGSTAVICVGNLPSATMPTVNIAAVAADKMSNDALDDWILNVQSNSKIYLRPCSGYTEDFYKVKVNTSELYSKSARFSITVE